MLEAAQKALKDFVVPQVEDQWAASALRSVDVILSHLKARAPIEGPMLHEDNGDLVEVLSDVKKKLSLDHEGLEAFLKKAPILLAGYASVNDLFALNEEGRVVVDDLLRACQNNKGESAADAAHQNLREYLLRHADRESPLFFPVFVGRPV